MVIATEAMVAAVIDRALKPGPRRAPKLAAELRDVQQHEVATEVGPVAAWRVGDGPAALLVHGWQDSSRLWSPLMAELAARRRAFVVLDLPAHGFSPGEVCLQTEVIEAVSAVARDLGPIDALVAHSFACGGVGIALVEGLPSEHLVLVAPPLFAGPRRWQRIARELGYDEAVGDAALDRYHATLPPSRVGVYLGDALPTLPLDVLLIASHGDERFPLDLAKEVIDRVPRGSLLALEDANHRNSARVPEAVTAIADFI